MNWMKINFSMFSYIVIIKFNTINYFPQLNESNKDYYYRIKIPEQEGNNNFVSV